MSAQTRGDRRAFCFHATGNARRGRERSRRVPYAGSANGMAIDAGAASSPRGCNRRMVSLNRAEPRCSRLPPARVTIF
jgi:hypothetical protein